MFIPISEVDFDLCLTREEWKSRAFEPRFFRAFSGDRTKSIKLKDPVVFFPFKMKHLKKYLHFRTYDSIIRRGFVYSFDGTGFMLLPYH